MTKMIVIGWAMCMVLAAGSVQAAENEQEQIAEKVFSLEETVQTGLERNPRIQGAEFGIKSSQSEVKSARGQFLPRASAGYSRTYLDSIRASGPTDQDYIDQTQETWRASVVQTLFAGKTIYNSYQIAKIEEEYSRVEKETEERELIREIQEEFLQLLKIQEDLRSLEDTVQRLEVSKEAAQAFVDRQMAPFVEVLQAEVELEEARQEMYRMKNEKNIHKARLNRLLDYEAQREIDYQGDLEDIDLDKVFDLQACLDAALEQRTELEFIEQNIRIADREKEIALGQKMPRVELEGSYVDRRRDYDQKGTDPMTGEPRDRDQENQYWTIGVNVEWEFFSGGQQYYRRQSMDHEVHRLRSMYEDTASSVATEARSAFLRLQEARERVHASHKTLETAQEGYSMEEERFKRRVGTIQDLLDAQDRLTRADANYNQALLDYQLSMAELYYAMGERNYALN